MDNCLFTQPMSPGRVIASTSSADRFGMSGDCVFRFSIVACLLLWFGVVEEGSFPLVATEGTRLAPAPHTAGGNAEERAIRSLEMTL